MNVQRPVGASHSDLTERARQCGLAAYAPYSGFHVGCIIETVDGATFIGANMENASFGLSMCAEVGALTAATVAGALDRIRSVTVAGGRIGQDGTLTGSEIVTPCGRCRQLILEAAQLGGHDILVRSASGDGASVESRSISDLLPNGFGSDNLSNCA